MLALLTAAVLLLQPAGPSRSATDAVADSTRQASTWRIDLAHSELRFRIRHLVSRVSGTFTDWDGTITGDPEDWASGSVTVGIRARSIDTRNEKRDSDLRSPDFFEVETYPDITFKSRSVTRSGAAVSIVGDLTIKATTRPVTLTGSYLGLAPGKEGKDRVAFEASTTINRLDYGVSWNRAVEGGGLLLGDDVTIEITIEAVKQPS